MRLSDYQENYFTCVFYSEDESKFKKLAKMMGQESEFGHVSLIAVYNIQEEVDDLEDKLDYALSLLNTSERMDFDSKYPN